MCFQAAHCSSVLLRKKTRYRQVCHDGGFAGRMAGGAANETTGLETN